MQGTALTTEATISGGRLVSRYGVHCIRVLASPSESLNRGEPSYSCFVTLTSQIRHSEKNRKVSRNRFKPDIHVSKPWNALLHWLVVGTDYWLKSLHKAIRNSCNINTFMLQKGNAHYAFNSHTPPSLECSYFVK